MYKIHNEIELDGHQPISKSQMKVIFFQLDNCICKVYQEDGGVGTGFFCLLPNPDIRKTLPVLITNNHVLKEKDLKNDKIKIEMLNIKKTKYLELKNRKVFTNKKIDITIIEIKPDLDDLELNQNFLEIDKEALIENNNHVKEGSNIYVLQIPRGVEESWADGPISSIKGDFIHHRCATKNGSSGGPILCLLHQRVIGVHRGAIEDYEKEEKKIANLGILIKTVIKIFNEEYPSKFDKIKLTKSTKEKKNAKDIQKNLPRNREYGKNKCHLLNTRKSYSENKTNRKNKNIISYYTQFENKIMEKNINNINQKKKKKNYSKIVYLAILAEQCHRYREMSQMLEYGIKYENEDINTNERNLLSISYKAIILTIKSSLNIIISYEKKEKEKHYSTFLPYIIAYKNEVFNELNKECQRIIKFVEKNLIIKAKDNEAKVFYKKIIGDYNRHIAEFAEGNQKKQAIDTALKYYEEAEKIAKGFYVFNPISLGLYLNISVFYYEILKNHTKAIDISLNIIEKVNKELPKIDEEAEENLESMSIYNLLKENVDMWVQ